MKKTARNAPFEQMADPASSMTKPWRVILACAFAALTAAAIAPVLGYTALWLYGEWFAVLRSWVFVLNGFVSALILGFVIAVPLGLIFFDAPVRWALLCASPAAALILVVSWLGRAEGASGAWWVVYTDAAQFLGVFVLCAYTSGRIRRASAI